MAKWWQYILNPIQIGVDLVKDVQNKLESNGPKTEYGEGIEEAHPEYLNNNPKSNVLQDLGDTLGKVYDDFTGQTAIKQQFENNKELAAYQTKMQEELYNKYSSPEAIMRQNLAAGLNPNLAYSSGSSGQSNVPSYQSPSAPLNMSYSDKFSKALSMMSNVLGVKNLVYSTVANREAAQQSWLKTLQENQRLNAMYRDNLVEGGIVGHALRNFLKGKKRYQIGKGFVTTEPYALDYYTEAIRNERINKAMQPGLYNQWEYGKYHSPLYGDLLEPVVLGEGIKPNSYWNNFNMQFAGKKRQFDYDWDNEYKTMLKGAGVAAPIIQTLLRILGGK